MKTIFRSSCRSHFTQLPNSMLRDNSISLRARGLLALCLSHSEDWVITKSWIIEQVPEGKHAVSAIFRELEASGYAVMTEQRDEVTKQFVSRTWTFYDAPVPAEARSHFSAKDADKRSDLPEAGNPVAGEPAPKNTKGEEYNRKEEYKQEPSAPVAHSDSKTPIAPADDPESQPSPPKQPIPLPSRREPTPSSAPPLPKRKATRSPEDHARYGKCLEAIVTVNGVKLSDCPKSAIAIAGKAVNEIWGVMPSVTPEEILQRIQRARVKFSWMKGINERTIATKWAELAVETKKQLTPENI